jgi:hypothetical protein
LTTVKVIAFAFTPLGMTSRQPSTVNRQPATNMHLSLITLGHVHAAAFEPLTPHLIRIEQLVVDLPPRVALAEKRAELNRAIDAASSDWVLILREREEIGAALAAEIAAAMTAAKAWGFRIRVEPIYAGRPLRLGDAVGEIRLLQRRHLIRRGELAVQGSVVRLEQPLRAITFESAAAHREYLARTAVPHSSLRRLLLFLRNARTLDRNTLLYLWIEAGYDHG